MCVCVCVCVCSLYPIYIMCKLYIDLELVRLWLFNAFFTDFSVMGYEAVSLVRRCLQREGPTGPDLSALEVEYITFLGINGNPSPYDKASCPRDLKVKMCSLKSNTSVSATSD